MMLFVNLMEWASSLTDSTAKGKPDIEAVDVTSRISTLDGILDVTTKPIIFDGDTGGIKEHFQFTVRTLERLGISAVIIEDKIGLKKIHYSEMKSNRHKIPLKILMKKSKLEKWLK